MTPETIKYAVIMLAAGIGVPVLAALNAQLGTRIGSPAIAGAMMFLIAGIAAMGVAAVLGQTNALAALPTQPRHLFLAGLLIAFYLLSISWVAPRFGVGNAVMFVLLGQIVAICVIDQFGLFGARLRPLDLPRIAGIVLMAVGVVLAQRPPS
ncbi:DMT family transporter [Roseinatronobacter alkalisoli]|uniref:DMT family transporter n=1 Tax=Roseinatronobacter alkalisoli TaxID=3028235 RepID=A0ABT5T7W0_9RHOB|nr:DMT family transporter [Roseinatronobacter sp. HJB301]MDD7971218.1 DMT family transporter [Roseinatronobacter sp. HJB301]